MIDTKATFTSAWSRQGGLLALLLLALLILYYPTFESIVAIWLRSETFAHGFIIAPISLWLIWRIRDQLLATEPKANYLGIPALLVLGFVWLLANYVGILAIEQLVVVMIIPVLVFTLLGWRTTTTMLFPLFFLLFAVPLGEELTPYLIDFTADFTVLMIKLVGIPIYREGNFFELPSGNWSVVAACSGVRYLIASVTLGVLYAYLTYHSPVKRAVFVTFSFVVPIIANGLRAFIIVMLGHISDMKLATGVDHLIYGWLFFGIVIAIMFYIGSFWRDDEERPEKTGLDFKHGDMDGTTIGGKLTVLIAAIALIVWPIKAHLEQRELDLSMVSEISVTAPQGWTNQAAETATWKPAYHGLDREFSAVYSNDSGHKVQLYIGYFAEQRQDAELGNYNNVLVQEKDETWRVIEEGVQTLPLQSEGVDAKVVTLNSNGGRLLTAYFYYVDGEVVTNKYETKLLQTKVRLLGGRNNGAIITISTSYPEEGNLDTGLLEEFTEVALPQIKAALDDMEPES